LAQEFKIRSAQKIFFNLKYPFYYPGRPHHSQPAPFNPLNYATD